MPLVHPPDSAEARHAIAVTNVTKHYRARPWSKPTPALRGVNFTVNPGEIFGLLGPNGAGKSTLVKILMTVIRPSRCEGTLLGRPVGHKGTLRRVGYLPEHHRFPEYLTARQALDYFATLSGVDRPTRRKRSADLLDQLGLAKWADRRIGQFSKGMRQRLGIAQSLINDPQLVLLDEPTDGVDPVGRRDIRAILVQERAKGRTIFLNSHLLSELEMVCDRVAIMVQGRVSEQGTIPELTAYGQRYEIAASAAGGESLDWHAVLAPLTTPSPPAAAAGTLALHDGTMLETDRGLLRVRSMDPATIQPIIDAVRASRGVIKSVVSVRPSLEDLFMRAVTAADGSTLPPGAAEDSGSKGASA